MVLCKDHRDQYNIDCPSCIAARRPRRPQWGLRVSDLFVIVTVLLCLVRVVLAAGPGEFVRGGSAILAPFPIAPALIDRPSLRFPTKYLQPFCPNVTTI